jgi:hypothetical protein
MCISKSIYLHNYIKVKVKFIVLKFIFITFPGQFSGDCSMTVALPLIILQRITIFIYIFSFTIDKFLYLYQTNY